MTQHGINLRKYLYEKCQSTQQLIKPPDSKIANLGLKPIFYELDQQGSKKFNGPAWESTK